MKKTNLTRTLLAACSIVALTAVMYGCVHSDDDPPPTDPPPMDDDDGDGDGDGDGGDGDGDDGDGDDGDGDDGDGDDGDGDGDDGDGDGDDEPTPEEIDAATEAAATKATAIMTEAAQSVTGGTPGTDGAGGANAGLGGSGAPASGAIGAYTLAIEHGSTTITVEGEADDDSDDVMFVDAMMGLDRGRTRLVNEGDPDMTTGDVVREIAIVGTDIEAPTDVPFAMWEALAADGFMTTTPQVLNAMSDNGEEPDVGEVANSLGVDEDGRAHVMLDRATTGGILHYSQDNPDPTNPTPDMDEGLHAGTYNGAEGMFRCVAIDPCTATFDADGMITGISTGWVFIPAMGATSSQLDYAYLSYGFWLQQTEDADGAITYDEVETFAMAHGYAPTNTTDLGTVLGTATYTGDTVGVYVQNDLDGQGNIVAATSGQFVADVTLNASFGGGNVLANNQFTIGGMIENFVLNGQFGEVENDWDVTLGLADFSGGRMGGGEPGMSAPGSSHTIAFDGVATGDSTAAAGSWNGSFHGEAAENTATTTDDDHLAPPAVTGEFNANFTDGMAAGGFGATND